MSTLYNSGPGVLQGLLVTSDSKVWANSGGGIYRFNMDGSSAGAEIGSDITPGASCMIQVGDIVWVACGGMAPDWTQSIVLLNLDGSSAGTPLTDSSLNNPVWALPVGDQIWILNQNGNTIARFNTDGTSAGAPIS
jgi:hypothetical protein